MTTRSLARWSTLAAFVAAGGCAGFGSPTFVAPGEGYDVTFKVADNKLRIRAISIDGQVACEPTAEGEGRPSCEDGFQTRLSPGRHYLQIQVTQPGETGHKDAEERLTFEAEGHYVCEVSERFVETKSTAVDQVGFSEPTVACRIATASELGGDEVEAAADEAEAGDEAAAEGGETEPPAEEGGDEADEGGDEAADEGGEAPADAPSSTDAPATPPS